MADDKKRNRKPVSLNDRHYRLLQDFSKPSFSEEEKKPSKVKLEGRRRLCKVSVTVDDDNCNIPQFSGIADFDSPHEEQEKPLKLKVEGQWDLSKASAGENEAGFGDDDSIPQFSGIGDFNSPPEDKPTKVRIEGRRRLCKVSSQDNENAENKVAVQHEPAFADITDFDSPIPPKALGDNENNRDVNEIRDILNDLSSRLDLLSIEKRKVPESIVNVADECSRLDTDVGREKVDVPEYESAESSFSCTSDPSDSSSDVSKNIYSAFQNAVDERELESHLLKKLTDDHCVDKVHEYDDSRKGLKKTGYRTLDDESVYVGNSFVPSVEVEEYDLHNEFEGDNHAMRVQQAKQPSQIMGKSKPKGVHERLRSVGRSFVPYLRDEDEEEDEDCVVLSGKEVVKKAGRCGGKSWESSGHSSVIDVSEDYADESVLEDDNSFTLTGPKFTYKLPSKIAKMLYPHQCEGLRWLWSLHCQGKGGILGDDMGLGKTMQICGFLAGLFHSRLIKRALVVAPKTLLSHWIKELSAVGLSGRTREYFGTSTKARQYELQYILQDKGILLTTYDIVRNNSKSLQGDDYFADEDSDGFVWDYMILDEGHLIKNPGTQRAKSLLEIPSAHRIVISGTPIQNNLKELWALFNFCCPNLLGDYKWFKERYEHAILRGNEKNASDRDKSIGSRVAKELRQCIQPYFLRRLKNEVFKEDDATTGKISKKNEIIVWLRLTRCQRQLYEAFLKSELVLSAFDGSPLAALTILKKICDHPLLLTKRAAEDVLEGMDSMLNSEDAGIAEKLAMHVADVAERTDFEEKHDNISCKISFILSLLDDLIPEGHNVLIFSQTRKMLNLIQDSLVSNGYEFLRIDGTTKASDRVKIVTDFQEGVGAPIFLLTSQVGGLGLTLTKADRVIVVDPAWNPSTDNQSVDRAYRIGQKKDVLVYRLMTCGTVEEKIYRKQIFKGGLFKSATEHKEQIRYFSQQDLRELFSLPKQGFDVSPTQQQLHEEHDSQHKMDESLEAHIKFLETQGIAGVSHHSLLFSKTAPVPVVQDEEDEIRRKGATFVGNSSSSNSTDRNVDGAVYAFNPKDVKPTKKSSSPDIGGKLTESQINERINRLSFLLGDKVTVSRLPDRGANLQKKISELNLELYKIRNEKKMEKVVDLEDLTWELQNTLNV